MALQIDKDTSDTLVAKLQGGFMRPSDVKRHVWHRYGVQLTGNTKNQVIQSLLENTHASSE